MDRQDMIAQLVEARLEKGLTQTELARMIGTQRSNISRLESGAQNPSLDMVLKIAAALGKDATLLLKDKEEPMAKEYSLRIYDTELMRFTMEKRGLEGTVVEIKWTSTENSKLLPLELEQTGEGVLKWLERRVIPKNRAFVDEILKVLGLTHNDTKGIIDVCMGLSLNDSYWVVPVGFEGTFGQYNLYENKFSEALSLVAYTGAGQSRQAFTTSPELTTNGMLRKAWRLTDGGIYLYKGGSTGASNAGQEPYCEYFASQVAERMGLNAVRYELENWKGITASKCALFTDIDTSYIPVGRLVKTGGIKACLDYYDSMGSEFAEQIRSMLIFDALILNEDRHFGNFGLLRDNHTGEIKAPAPIFDNGLSLLCYAGKDDLKDYAALSAYAALRTNPYGIPFEEVCREVMGPVQKSQLRRMIGFRFRRDPSVDFPERRLAMLEQLLEERTRKLLSIPPRRKMPPALERSR